MPFAEFEVLFRIQGGSPLDPGMNRVRRDDVKFLRRSEDEMPGVVVDYPDATVCQDVVVLFGEESRNGRRDQGLNFANQYFIDVRMQNERAGGNAGSAADDQYTARLAMQQRGYVTEHTLQPHIVGFGGRLDLAADMEK